MKKQLILLVLVWPCLLQAQQTIKGLFSAEREFAAYSRTHGTRAAFLQFADTSGLLFERGKPVNAIQVWTLRPDQDGTLDWAPTYGGLAASANFGFTSGPWTFSRHDTIISKGYFITIWHRNGRGQWKFLVDLGVSTTVSCDEAMATDRGKKPATPRGELADLKKQEDDLVLALSEKGVSAYSAFQSGECRYFRNGGCPVITPEAATRYLDPLPPSATMVAQGSGIAPSGDLGYVYGKLQSGEKTDAYLHIWRREKGAWKLALEVLRY